MLTLGLLVRSFDQLYIEGPAVAPKWPIWYWAFYGPNCLLKQLEGCSVEASVTTGQIDVRMLF